VALQALGNLDADGVVAAVEVATADDGQHLACLWEFL
jgi:hypothetical protein